MNGIIFELEEKSKYTGRYMDGEISYNNTSIDYTKEIRECDRKSEIKDLLNDPCLGKIFEKGEVDDEIIYNGNIEDVKEEWMRAIQNGVDKMNVKKLNFIRYSEMKNWSVRELFGEDLEQADRALINKVYHMLFDIGSDFESVIRMLYSFRNGPKSGIKVADPEDNYEWTNKDGNEKYSTKNLPKAHFRWDWRRYTLSKESVDKITEFVDTILKS